MAPKEQEPSKPKQHPERWRSDFDIEAFHAVNRLWWDKPKQPTETTQQEVERTPVPPESTGDRNEQTSLGKDFLDATDHLKPKPEAPPIETRLSIEATSYLKEITWNFERLKNDLVASKGEVLEENPIIAGLALDEYLAFIQMQLLNDKEFAYITRLIDGLQASLKKIQQALLAEHAPKPSVLERLEALQGTKRSERFPPPKKNET